MEITLTLCSPQDINKTITLYYELLDRPIAKKYLLALKECVSQNYQINNKERFYGFPNDYRNENWIKQQIQLCAESLNSYSPGLVENLDEFDFDQCFMNRLHKIFEECRGSTLSPASFYKEAPRFIQKVLDDLNLYIHRLERLKRIQEQRDSSELSAAAILTFGGERRRYPLQDEDYSYFTSIHPFGAWQINYCEAGKQILDVYFDKDEFVGENNIRPHRYYSADAKLSFSTPISETKYKSIQNDFKLWWSENTKKLKKIGLTSINDPKNAFGYIQVASLKRKKGSVAGLSDKEIVTLVSEHQCFLSVSATHTTDKTSLAQEKPF